MDDVFDIDEEQLKQLSSKEAFVLGVEYAIFRNVLSTGDSFSAVVHLDNAERLSKLASTNGRTVTTKLLNDDWAELKIGNDPGLALFAATLASAQQQAFSEYQAEQISKLQQQEQQGQQQQQQQTLSLRVWRTLAIIGLISVAGIVALVVLYIMLSLLLP